MIHWPETIKHNKYRDWYEKIVQSASNRIYPIGIYGESHHIIPRSLGGENIKENIVRVSGREHYILHLLLWKMDMSPKMHNKMTMALHVMVNGSGNKKQDRSYLVPSRTYELSRKAYSKLLSEERAGTSNSFYGKTHTPESIQKIKEANARTKNIRSAKLSGEGNGFYGKTHTDATKKLISGAVIESFSDERREEYSKRLTARWKSPEYQKMMEDARSTSEGWLNRDWKAINRKAADTKMANGWKQNEESKRKISETRRAKLASGEIVPWNKGKGVLKTILTEEEKLQRKITGIERMKATKMKNRLEKHLFKRVDI